VCRFLVGDGAKQYAKDHGIEMTNPLNLISGQLFWLISQNVLLDHVPDCI
jgi:hypothetical protein